MLQSNPSPKDQTETGRLSDSVTLVVPAFNEAESLQTLAPDLLAFCSTRGWRVIIVDDGSTDATPAQLRVFDGHPSLTILRHKVNRGYGAALRTGLSHVQTEYALTFDADGQFDLADTESLVRALADCDADMVVGRRTGLDQTGWYRRLGRAAIRKVASLMVPLSIHDLNSGFKGYRAKLVKQYLHLCPDGMAFSDVMALVFISRGHLVSERPVRVKPRSAGTSTITTRTAFETTLEILNILMLFNPLRIFLPVAVICIAFGLLWELPIALAGRGVSVGSMLAIVTGLLCFFLGLLAEQLALIQQQADGFDVGAGGVEAQHADVEPDQ